MTGVIYLVPYAGGRHLRHLHRRSMRCYYALIAVLGRALSTSYAPLRPASACAVSVVGLHGHVPHLQLSSDAQARLVNVLSVRCRTLFPSACHLAQGMISSEAVPEPFHFFP